MVTSTDVLVIGGGPAGLAAALALRARGVEVLVADGMGPVPIDKACGEGLMPDSVAALAHLGVDVLSQPFGRFSGIRFVGAKSAVEAHFPQGCGVGVRRTALHSLMTRAALDAGAQLIWNAPALGMHDGIVQFGSHTVKAHWIVGADGGRSQVRRWAGLDAYMSDTRCTERNPCAITVRMAQE